MLFGNMKVWENENKRIIGKIHKYLIIIISHFMKESMYLK
jgi:hypothetical protein